MKSDKTYYGEPGNLKEEDFCVQTAGSLLSGTLKTKQHAGAEL